MPAAATSDNAPADNAPAHPGPTAAMPGQRPPSLRWALAGLSLSMLLSSLGTSSANVALPTLARELHASFQATQWVVLAYLLAITASIVTAGRLGDVFGRKRLLRVGLLLFTVGSALSAVAPSLPALLAARAVQGGGAAIMMALTVAFVSDVFPKAQTGRAMGLLGTMSAVGTALGPSVGGLLIAQLGWRAIFLVNVPLGVLALLLAQRHLPADRAAARPTHGTSAPSVTRQVDLLGTALLAVTLGLYALAMTLGRGHFGALNAGLLLAAAVGACLFALVERRVSAPLLSMRMFRQPALNASLASNFLVSAVLMSTLIVGPFYLSLGLGLPAAAVGLVMSVGPVVAAVSGVPAGRGVDRFGPERMSTLGLAAIAVGALLLSAAPVALGVLGYVAPLGVVTAGYALFQAANNTAVMRDASAGERGVVSGTLTLSRNLGLVTGASVMGAVFALASGTRDVTLAAPLAVTMGMRVTFALGAALAAVAIGLFALARAHDARRVSDEQASARQALTGQAGAQPVSLGASLDAAGE